MVQSQLLYMSRHCCLPRTQGLQCSAGTLFIAAIERAAKGAAIVQNPGDRSTGLAIDSAEGEVATAATGNVHTSEHRKVQT